MGSNRKHEQQAVAKKNLRTPDTLKPRDPAPKDIVDEQVRKNDIPIVVRGLMALMVLPETNAAPDSTLIERFKGAVAMHWRVPAVRIKHVAFYTLHTSSHRVYLLHPDAHHALDIAPNDARSQMLSELLWRLGSQGMQEMLRRHPWLATKPPSGTPTHRVGGESKVLGMAIPMGLWYLMINKTDLASRMEEALPTNADWETSIEELLDGCHQSDPQPFVVPSHGAMPADRTVDIFDPDRLREAKERLDGMQPEVRARVGGMYQRMKDRGPQRILVRAPAPSALDDVMKRFPNFSEITAFLCEQLALARLYDGALSFPPILMVGDPGVGKTEYTHALAKALGMVDRHDVLPMATTSASFVLTGSSSVWQSARPGKIALRLLEGDAANPLMIADEIDKASQASDARYPAINALLALLEHATARTHTDEWLEVPIDASRLLWLATANDLETIPDPVQSRFMVFPIDPLTVEQTRLVAANLYAAMMEEPYGAHFEPELHAEVLDALEVMTPRELRLALMRALGRASLRAATFGTRRRIGIDDLDKPKRNERHPIGFCTAA